MAVIGQLNRRIEIQELRVIRDAFGGEIERWRELGKVWAEVMQTGQDETYRNDADRDQAVRNARMRIRYRGDVDETMRVIYDGHAWDVEGIAEWGFRDSLLLSVRADVSGDTAYEFTPLDSALISRITWGDGTLVTWGGGTTIAWRGI